MRKDVEPHDIVVASRSLSHDLKESMLKLASAAKGRLFYPAVVHLPFDWEVYQVISRIEESIPHTFMYSIRFTRWHTG